jgi:hypothetical protein
VSPVATSSGICRWCSSSLALPALLRVNLHVAAPDVDVDVNWVGKRWAVLLEMIRKKSEFVTL